MSSKELKKALLEKYNKKAQSNDDIPFVDLNGSVFGSNPTPPTKPAIKTTTNPIFNLDPKENTSSCSLPKPQKRSSSALFFELNQTKKDLDLQRQEIKDLKKQLDQIFLTSSHQEQKSEVDIFIPNGEANYISLLEQCYEFGEEESQDRTKVGTIALFSTGLEFDLSDGSFPLMTCRKMYFAGVVKEWLWMFKGQTDNNILEKQGVKIWCHNTSREFLDKTGLTDYREGDSGPIYGFQMRHFGAEYKTCDDDYTGQGVDQLVNVFNEMKSNPSSRRLLVNCFNVKDLPKMALPPCHYAFQFVCKKRPDGKINCSLEFKMRSSDMILGLPWNIAFYALTLKFYCHCLGYEPHRLACSLTDAHIYKNHFENLQTLFSRKDKLYPFPKLNIVGINTSDSFEKILDSVSEKNFVLTDYKCHDAIDFKLN